MVTNDLHVALSKWHFSVILVMTSQCHLTDQILSHSHILQALFPFDFSFCKLFSHVHFLQAVPPTQTASPALRVWLISLSSKHIFFSLSSRPFIQLAIGCLLSGGCKNTPNPTGLKPNNLHAHIWYSSMAPYLRKRSLSTCSVSGTVWALGIHHCAKQSSPASQIRHTSSNCHQVSAGTLKMLLLSGSPLSILVLPNFPPQYSQREKEAVYHWKMEKENMKNDPQTELTHSGDSESGTRADLREPHT